MRTHPHSMTHLTAMILFLMGAFVLAAPAAEDKPEMTVEEGEAVYEFLQGTDIEMKMEDEQMSFILTYGGDGEGLAKLRITRGEEVTHVEGETIYVWTAANTFKIEGRARVERGEDVLVGPVSLTFDGEKNTLEVVGDDKAPAEVSFVWAKGRFNGRARRWIGTFAGGADEGWRLTGFKSEKAASGRLIQPSGGGAPVILDGLKSGGSEKTSPGRKVSQ